MKASVTDTVLVILAVAGMIYLCSGIALTWYPHKTAEEVAVIYWRQNIQAKPWP